MAMLPASGVSLRRDLTATAYEYADQIAISEMIGLKVAPIFKTGEAKSSYPIITRKNFTKQDNDKRGSDGRYNFIDTEFDSGNFDCEDRGLSDLLDDARKKRYATFLDFEAAVSRILTYRMMMGLERRIAAMAFNAVTFTAHNATTSWATATTADPAGDVQTGCRAISRKTGIPKSRISLICPESDFDLLCKTAAIIAQVQYTFSGNAGVRPAVLKPQHIATVLGIKEVLVPDGAYDSAPEGETESLTAVWTEGKAMLAVLAEGENYSLELPAAFRTMLWVEDSLEYPVIDRYYDNDRRGEVIRARANSDEVLTSEADLLSYYIDTLAAS